MSLTSLSIELWADEDVDSPTFEINADGLRAAGGEGFGVVSGSWAAACSVRSFRTPRTSSLHASRHV